jgi:ribosome biogenesis protein SSF1/2
VEECDTFCDYPFCIPKYKDFVDFFLFFTKMARGKKKSKKRTHVVTPPDKTIPRSFVIKSGVVTTNVAALIRDFRRIMEPNTASNLKERKSNKIKDFLMVAGQLMVTHLIIFTNAGNGGVNMRIGKIPRGPTLTFHVESFSLIKDVLAIQKRPRTPGTEYTVSPLVVLNNFSQKAKHVDLMAKVLQAMFPAIKVSKVDVIDVDEIK